MRLLVRARQRRTRNRRALGWVGPTRHSALGRPRPRPRPFVFSPRIRILATHGLSLEKSRQAASSVVLVVLLGRVGPCAPPPPGATHHIVPPRPLHGRRGRRGIRCARRGACVDGRSEGQGPTLSHAVRRSRDDLGTPGMGSPGTFVRLRDPWRWIRTEPESDQTSVLQTVESNHPEKRPTPCPQPGPQRARIHRPGIRNVRRSARTCPKSPVTCRNMPPLCWTSIRF